MKAERVYYNGKVLTCIPIAAEDAVVDSWQPVLVVTRGICSMKQLPLDLRTSA